MSLIKARIVDTNYSDIWRVFISGSSSAGKTYFAKQLLASKLFDVKRIYYFHPDIHESFPIDWCNDSNTEIVCQAGIPTLEDINQMPKQSVIVLDDLFTEVAKSDLMSYLFRVLSSKKKLHVIVMTQRYYAEGSKGLNIRNCSNYHVLMSNADVRTNMRVAFSMGLDKEIRAAIKANEKKLYPYIVIDRTNQARVNGIQVYIDILDKFMKVIIDGHVKVLVPNKEFKENWELVADGYAKSKEIGSTKVNNENVKQSSKKPRLTNKRKSNRLQKKIVRAKKKCLNRL